MYDFSVTLGGSAPKTWDSLVNNIIYLLITGYGGEVLYFTVLQVFSATNMNI